MNFKIILLIPLYLFVAIQLFYPLEAVGKIISISGKVSFDIQGRAMFIRPQAGDVLYDCSVIKTENDGLAVILVGIKEQKIPADTVIRIKDLLCADVRDLQVNELIFKQFIQSLKTIVADAFEKVEKKGKGRLETQPSVSRLGRQFVSEKDLNTEPDNEVEDAFRKKDYRQALYILQKQEKSMPTLTRTRYTYALQAMCSFLLGKYQQTSDLFAMTVKQLDNEIVYEQTAVQNEIAILNNLSLNQWAKKNLYTLVAGIAHFMLDEQSQAIPYFRIILQAEADDVLKAYTSYFLSLALLRIGANLDATTCLEKALAECGQVLPEQECTRLLKLTVQ